jgi:hypothetical protein
MSQLLLKLFNYFRMLNHSLKLTNSNICAIVLISIILYFQSIQLLLKASIISPFDYLFCSLSPSPQKLVCGKIHI